MREVEELVLEELELDGQTFAEWAAELFEFELCEECGGDAEDHEARIVMGHWFAKCKSTD